MKNEIQTEIKINFDKKYLAKGINLYYEKLKKVINENYLEVTEFPKIRIYDSKNSKFSLLGLLNCKDNIIKLYGVSIMNYLLIVKKHYCINNESMLKMFKYVLCHELGHFIIQERDVVKYNDRYDLKIIILNNRSKQSELMANTIGAKLYELFGINDDGFIKMHFL